jgi:hypothetical protein
MSDYKITAGYLKPGRKIKMKGRKLKAICRRIKRARTSIDFYFGKNALERWNVHE